MARRPTPRRLATFVCAWLVLAALEPARANGAFPDEFSIHFPPDAPRRIYVGANFGMLVSEDDGLTWRYACEPWVVAGSNAALAFASVSLYQIAADGALIAASPQASNMTRSVDVACTWPASTGAVTNQNVADFFPDPNDASFVLAIVVRTVSPPADASYVVASHDGGKTFDPNQLYHTPDLLTGIEIARSKRGVVYATSTSLSGGTAKFLASTDSGVTWTSTALDLPSASEPRILAVDPVDEKKVYLRIATPVTDEIRMTADGGKTFQTILPPVAGQMSSFLRAADGAVYAGTRAGKLYVQPAGETGFVARDAPHLRCLGQRPGASRIYACADMVIDGYSLGKSDDNGTTFQRVMSFTELLGPLTCAPVQTNCQSHWERIQGVLGISRPDAGQGGSSKGGSSCASTGADVWSFWLLVAFTCRRRRTAARGPAPSR
jgi:photosystem II stability/assembly factor-like uncharacterized protein